MHETFPSYSVRRLSGGSAVTVATYHGLRACAEARTQVRELTAQGAAAWVAPAAPLPSRPSILTSPTI